MPRRRTDKQKQRTASPSTTEDMQVLDGYVRLPHNMGIVKRANNQAGLATGSASNVQVEVLPAQRYALRNRKTADSSQATDRSSLLDSNAPTQEPPLKRHRTQKGSTTLEEEIQPNERIETIPKQKTVSKQGRSPYQKYTTVSWGETPWPALRRPSAAECEEVYAILKAEHTNPTLQFERPAKLPPPSLEVAGCGETQLIVDGLMRTILSANTTMGSANTSTKRISSFYGAVTKSFKVNDEETNLVNNFIDWNKVRELGVDELKSQIQLGGLQGAKSRAIICNLEKIHGLNAERVAAFKREKATGIPANIPDAERMTQSQKDMEIWMFENDVPSLEHFRSLSIEEVMNELIQLQQVGVKTAACVLLFSLQEPCFGVDTHVFRMAQWLGWLPADINERSGRDKAFAHLDVRVPDHLKYGLHQLFIEHGQKCYRCMTETKEGTKTWKSCKCPLEHLLNRMKKERKESSSKRKAKEMEDSDDRSQDDVAHAKAISNSALLQDPFQESQDHDADKGVEGCTQIEHAGASNRRAAPENTHRGSPSRRP